MKTSILRYTIAMLLMIYLPFTGNAQQGRGYFTNTEDVFFGGLVAGMNFTTVEGDGYSGYHKVGFNGGGTVYVKFASRFLTSIELLYTQKGSRGVRTYDSYYSGTFAERYFLDLNYVEVPLVFHYAATDKWLLGAGASYAQLLNSKEEMISEVPVYIDPDIYQFRKQDIAVVANANLQFAKGLFLNLRYQHSLATIRDANKVAVGGGTQISSVFTLRLMYLFR